MIASLLLVAVTGTVAPAPSQSAPPYPVIVHTVSSRSCTVLSDTIQPVGFVLKKDDDAFGGMSDRLQKIFTDFSNQGGGPTSQQLMQLGGSNYHGPDAGHNSDDNVVDPSNGTENQLFSPPQLAKAAEVEAIATAVHGNLALASQVLDKSMSALPQGSDQKADEMRGRAQALIALQTSFDQNYEKFMSTYVNNQNVYWATKSDQRAYVTAYLVALLTGHGATADGAADPDANKTLPDSQRAQIAAIAGVVQNLRSDEAQFGAELVSTYNQCNGTNITVNASPSPNPY